MNVLYFKLYDFNVEVKSSDTPLKHLKINAELAFFSVMKPEGCDLRIHIGDLPVLFRKGLYIGNTDTCEVRQVSLSKRQIIYEKFGRTLAVVNDDTKEPVRQVELQAENQDIVDEILFGLIVSCAREFLECRESSHSFPLLEKQRISQSWPFLVRPNNIKILYRIFKNRRRLAKI